MPRWLIAVFTLHFLLSLGASAFGKMPAVPLSSQANARSIQTALAHQHVSTQSVQDPAEAQATADVHECSLADTNQDLQDDQHIQLFGAGSSHAQFHCPTAMATTPSSAWLKKQPKRPRAGLMLRRA